MKCIRTKDGIYKSKRNPIEKDCLVIGKKENGKLVLKYMQDNKENYNNLFKAKEIGEGLGISSRTASGAMRKLVTDGYIEKIGESPVVYSLTESGTEVDPNAD